MNDHELIIIEVMTAQELADAYAAELRRLGISEDELNRQAESGLFQSDRARLLWMDSI